MENKITFTNVNKSFYSLKEETVVLNQISFDVKKGEIVAIVGPSGCGKSTLLNLISGLIQPDSGKIEINGKVGYMFQKDHLFEWRTVYKNITLGQELAKTTGLKFMHNHETIDLPLKFFEFKSEQRERLTDLFRFSIFEEVAKSDLKGMIFTLMWAFERQEDWDWVQRIKDIYDKENGEFYVVELETTLEERLKRNKTENRLKNKPTKRDLEFSEKELLKSVDKHRLNSYEGEVKYENYIKINNTNISAEDTAKIIQEKFKL